MRQRPGGQLSGVGSYLYLYAQYNSGAVQLCISSVGSYDQGSLQTTLAIGATSTSSTALYCTAAATGPIRLLGRMLSQQATAGTWVTPLSNVALSPFNVGDVWSGYIPDFGASCGTSPAPGSTTGSAANSVQLFSTPTVPPGVYYVTVMEPQINCSCTAGGIDFRANSTTMYNGTDLGNTYTTSIQQSSNQSLLWQPTTASTLQVYEMVGGANETYTNSCSGSVGLGDNHWIMIRIR